jgi:hypothetical protein
VRAHACACVFVSRTEAPAAILVAWVQVCLCLNLCVLVCMRVLDKERHVLDKERHVLEERHVLDKERHVLDKERHTRRGMF